ncbi:radical SAM protein [Paenibacillus sp. FSL H7-0756]|uniref:radical SAM protein n=1 Tax=Paenibacillus sp. FSL H7-0756 TaxID=2954738 RepID=UPI0030FBF43C
MKGIHFESRRKNKYYYDDETGQIVSADDDPGLLVLKDKFNLPSQQKIEKIESSQLNQYLYVEANGFKQLILEISSACNLRCKYCIYSEHYPYTREHGTSRMTWDVAKASVDFYYYNFKKIYERNPMRKAIISFYGGEPLTNIPLLKQVVNYINQEYGEYEVLYNITTNGLLLTPEIQKFLFENHFSVLVSLDGYPENHNRNRVDVKGRDTADIVLKHIDQFRGTYPDASLSIATCFDYKTDFEEMADFFDSNQLSVIHTGQVQTQNSTYYSQFNESDEIVFFEKYNKLKEEFFKKSVSNDIDKSKFLYRFFGSIYATLAFHPMIREASPLIRPYTGTCVPGEKIYVTTEGKFQICEKINSAYEIGNVHDGLDLERITKVLNDYNQNICVQCQECPISRLCNLCFKNFETENGFESNSDICLQQRKTMENLLGEFVSMLEDNPRLYDEVTSDYFKTMSEVGECI